MDDLVIASIVGGVMAILGVIGGSFLDRSFAHRLEEVRDELAKLTHREVEQHRFRHDIGQEAAKARMAAYTRLGDLAAAVYRSTMGEEWTDRDVVANARDRLNEARNYFYDHHYFFSVHLRSADEGVGVDRKGQPIPTRSEARVSMNRAFREFDSAVVLEPDAKPQPRYPNKENVERKLRQLNNTIRADLLLDQLSDSAQRAIEAGEGEVGEVVTYA